MDMKLVTVTTIAVFVFAAQGLSGYFTHFRLGCAAHNCGISAPKQQLILPDTQLPTVQCRHCQVVVAPYCLQAVVF